MRCVRRDIAGKVMTTLFSYAAPLIFALDCDMMFDLSSYFADQHGGDAKQLFCWIAWFLSTLGITGMLLIEFNSIKSDFFVAILSLLITAEGIRRHTRFRHDIPEGEFYVICAVFELVLTLSSMNFMFLLANLSYA